MIGVVRAQLAKRQAKGPDSMATLSPSQGHCSGHRPCFSRPKLSDLNKRSIGVGTVGVCATIAWGGERHANVS